MENESELLISSPEESLCRFNKSDPQCLAYQLAKTNYLSTWRRKIPFVMFQTRRNFTQFIYFWNTALHVSGGISNHHQEHTQLYLQYLVYVKPLLPPAAIVDELELV